MENRELYLVTSGDGVVIKLNSEKEVLDFITPLVHTHIHKYTNLLSSTPDHPSDLKRRWIDALGHWTIVHTYTEGYDAPVFANVPFSGVFTRPWAENPRFVHTYSI